MVQDNVLVPEGSIYFWMYEQGLKQVELEKIYYACKAAGVAIRDKDYDNYWRGWYKADLYRTDNWERLFKFKQHPGGNSNTFTSMSYSDYPIHPYRDEIEERWVPCNAANKPMIKWGNGCMSHVDAMSYTGQVYLAENLKGCNHIVIDCDGDHSDKLDLETISFLWRYSNHTHTMMKPKRIMDYAGYENTGLEIPASFHLTFEVTRVIPTMHFPFAGIDIIGNRCNSLRYFKNKKWNKMPVLYMTDEIWNELVEYIKHRKAK